ncbi:MAG: hypothetical protein AB7I13_10490 [Vicinamibacterales bacterium]
MGAGRIVAALCCLVFVSRQVSAGTCARRLLTAPATELLISTHEDFAGRAFVDGISCRSEIPDDPEQSCDYQARVVDERLLDDRPGSERRLVKAADRQVVGASVWDYLIVFACNPEGRIAIVLERGGLWLGLDIEYASADALEITRTEHLSSEPPPSLPFQQVRERLRWDAPQRRYLVEGETYHTLAVAPSR